jgi:ABC-type multidrug transport system fused ATPase/permease subunit
LYSRIRENYENFTIVRSSRILPKKDRKKILYVAIIQVISGLMDLLGVAIIGILGALAISGVQSSKPGNRVNYVLSFLHLQNQSLQMQAAILGGTAALVLIARTAFSITFTRRTLFFLSRRSALISSDLISRLLSKSLLTIQERSTQETLYSVTHGVGIITLGIIGTGVILISDVSLLIILFTGLFIIDPTLAISTSFVFIAIGLILYRLMNVRARNLGFTNTKLSILSSEKILEVLNSYRESVVRNRRSYYTAEIKKTRLEISDTIAEMQFMPNVTKYVIETTVILGALIIGGVQFLMQDAKHAIATLSLFLAAGTRIAPAVLRIQQNALQIKSNLGIAQPTLRLIDELGQSDLDAELAVDELDLLHNGFVPKIEIEDISFRYPNADNYAISGITLDIAPGSTVAIVGSSGAGKTTLIDAILGVLPINEGAIRISGESPAEVVSRWPGAIAYVPQDVMISNGTVRQNIALGFPIEAATPENIEQALSISQLRDFVSGLPQGIDTEVGEKGSRISGGQRQRLGIARAMFTNPLLLVLDEATSSLDGETEANIAEAVRNLKGKVTVVMIAHRLSTVREADQVIYMESGKIVATGTFESVRNKVANFDRQAQLMGL